MLAIARISKSASSRVFHPDGGVTGCLHQIPDKAESLSIRFATVSCRNSRNGASVENPGKLSTASKFTLLQRLALSRPGTLTGTPNRNYDHASTERSTNSLVSRILFWGSALPRFFKGRVFSGSISKCINVDNAISQATSGANIFLPFILHSI